MSETAISRQPGVGRAGWGMLMREIVLPKDASKTPARWIEEICAACRQSSTAFCILVVC
jgi:hypothetical protein